MKKSLLAIALLAATAAYATNKPTPTNPTTPITVTAGAQAQAGAQSDSNADASNSLSNTFGRQNLYVFPAPVNAAPLPANLCPQGDSISWSIGWNFISYAKSTTRTEMQCLEMVLTSIKAAAPVIQPAMIPLTPAEQKELACLEQPKQAVVAKKKKRLTCR